MELNVGQGGFSDNPSELPGFRFYPTDQELLGFYLKRMVQGKLHNFNYIRILDLYRYDPWDLPSFARLGERELFFFVPRDEKTQKNRGRPSRITASGYWKATGSDRWVREDNAKCIGLKKTLVFYRGRAPLGQKTDWIMNEYRLPDTFDKPKIEVVLCRIHKKGTSLKWLEHKAMSQAEVTSTNEDLDCLSPDSQLSPAKIDDDKRVDQEAKSTCHEIRTKPSSTPQDNGTKSNTNSSLGCAVDSELNNLMESTIDGGLIDPVFQTFGNESNKVEGFSSIVAMLAASPSSCAVERCWDPLLHSAMAEEPASSARIRKLSLDFCNEKAISSGNGNLQNPWTDLWTESTPHCFQNSSVDFLGYGHGGL